MSLENVRSFYERLASDEAFRTQIQSVESKEAGREILQNAGFDFTKEEFEEYTAQLLESENELQDVDPAELASVVGGLVGLYPIFFLIYGAPSGLWNYTNLLP
ncbi:MAG: Nif11-like leader peptide family natural product precursor [Aulosira sp. ZfuVER01]|nr:Nif11-like leader peptide family natural product precursor [Aulosira sp. ZfuVER01]MDZ7997955.1 Nif11-like leader peptide family natural product precursor [Aulosira sp. DedVER01a]MDZ8054654.1 Nif11-like leader peptide family natural product precursor [Aulosira sp. ZfuCHP01]